MRPMNQLPAIDDTISDGQVVVSTIHARLPIAIGASISARCASSATRKHKDFVQDIFSSEHWGEPSLCSSLAAFEGIYSL